MTKKKRPNIQKPRPLTDKQKQFRAEQFVKTLGLPVGYAVDVYVDDAGEITAAYQQPPTWRPSPTARKVVIPSRTTIR